MRVLIYESEGTDGLKVPCQSVQEAIRCFRADAEVAMQYAEAMDIRLTVETMTAEEFAAIPEA